MGGTQPAYPLEFRRQMVELVRAGRDPEDLAREFEPSAQAIRNWVRQAERDGGQRTDGLTTGEREELARLRRENRQLRQERAILAKAAAWFARETGAIPPGSSSSWARTRPNSPSPPWRACSVFPGRATTPGAAALPRPGPCRTPRC